MNEAWALSSTNHTYAARPQPWFASPGAKLRRLLILTICCLAVVARTALSQTTSLSVANANPGNSAGTPNTDAPLTLTL